MGNGKITLRSNILRITGIKKRTAAKTMKDWVVGDAIELVIVAGHVGGNRGSSYTTDIAIHNITQGTVVYKTMNTLSHFTGAFALEFENETGGMTYVDGTGCRIVADSDFPQVNGNIRKGRTECCSYII